MAHSLVARTCRHRVFRASVIRAVALGLAVVASVVIARVGGPGVKGLTSAFASACIVAFTVVNVDLAQQLVQDGRQNASLHLIRSRILAVMPGYAAITGMAVAIAWLLDSSAVVWISLGTLAYLSSAFIGFAANALSGPGIASWGAVLQQFGLILGAVVLWRTGLLNVETAPAIILVSFLTPFPLYYFAARPHDLKSVDSQPAPRTSLRTLLMRGLAWQPARLAQLMLQRLDLLFVFAALGAAPAGVYSVGLATSSLAGVVPAQFASNVTYEAIHGRDHLLKQNARRALLAGSTGAIMLAALGKPLMDLAYGPNFSDAYNVLLWSLPGAVAYGLIQVFTNHVRIMAGPRAITMPSLAGLVVMAAALILLVPRYEIVGAAVAFSSGTLTTLAAVLRSRPSIPAAEVTGSAEL